ncbi:hypothetical protein [Piscinibacter sakaiensis]|uniref:Transmembrane protein n=1 Tax=Piscinibacter sakaiensis TaxID=1547922 RepID=A0A0K8P7D0_PISS1|nr:hypothetical protein [Piscinibacter sakaiensis]GAP38532.1 hypothetical protein ISF6_4990 [Piscinibacter sakaiensis]
MLIAVWILTLLGLALWSAAAWGLHAVLSIDPARLQDLKPWLETLPYRDLLERWVPGWQALLGLAIDLTQSLLAWVGHAAPWLVAAVWALGCLGLLATAGLASLAIVLIRRGMRASDEQRRLRAAT